MILFDPLAGTLTRDGRPLHLPSTELELCVALALLPVQRSSAALIEKLHPDVEPCVAKNRLKVCIHRTRVRLGADCIVNDGSEFSLAADAIQVIDETWRLSARPMDIATMEQRDCDAIALLVDKLLAPRPQCMLDWEWFAPIWTRIERLARAAAAALAERALSSGDVWQAVNIATKIIDIDPWDEPLRAILIRAHLHAGRHGEAVREYQRYEFAIRRDLQARPSPYLRKMIEEIVA